MRPVPPAILRFAEGLRASGAEAVALVGSHARGDADLDSDVDLAVIGVGPAYRLELYDGLLVSVGWAPAEEQHRRLLDPQYLATHVPGWRDALLLADPEGLAAAVQQEALAWEWAPVAASCDAWVAKRVTGFAEEAVKLAGALRRGDEANAAFQCSVLALHLPSPLAVRRRILYGSENRLLAAVADALGPAWSKAHAAAQGLAAGESTASARAGLDLFRIAVEEVRPLLDGRQSAVVEHALERAGASSRGQVLNSSNASPPP